MADEPSLAERMVLRGGQLERELAAARAKEAELRALCDELIKAAALANQTSDGYRDQHAAWQRWAARHAPTAIGDEAKRAMIDVKLTDTLEKRTEEALAELTGGS